MIVYGKKHCLRNYYVMELAVKLFFYCAEWMAELRWVYHCLLYVHDLPKKSATKNFQELYLTLPLLQTMETLNLLLTSSSKVQNE